MSAGHKFGAVVAASALPVIAFLFWGIPTYFVWERHMAGRAELAQAEYNRQIAVQEAKAKLEASKALADAEVERAKGVAEANRIIGDSLKDNEGYLHYLFIDALAKGEHDVVYIPTEAGLPILEAGRQHGSRRKVAAVADSR